LPALVIFDCDGVLIDSEVIFGRVLGQCLIAADFPVTMDEAMVLGLGKNRITLTAEMTAAAKSDNRHAGCDGSLHANRAVLDDDAALTRRTELSGGEQEEVGEQVCLARLARR
jgi:beta-phosphoglucomutase-like phosphatase (HAD superfamily)